ncbi:AfsR/SARP family transcriptional regulator [Nonomuraea turcica]|uniref:AfsR/SARP family transcriptional regulator n=1 Tax=Nonomuraea sp. G32 TaxID=3067274 RepID=UPI00273B854A|nr:winged helix-turn-helix domain-containing protein [Nonomuraea sp. G32]MDP4511567.1 winged helix-turn-helix domain-containing protein [Nonomuraea sp. G32]
MPGAAGWRRHTSRNHVKKTLGVSCGARGHDGARQPPLEGAPVGRRGVPSVGAPSGFRAGRRFLGPSTRQRRSVLAMLLLNPGRTVPFDRLMRALWKQEPPASARNAVQGYVPRLRRLPETGLSISLPACAGSTNPGQPAE